MKKLLSLLVAAVMVFSFAGCSNKTDSNNETGKSNSDLEYIKNKGTMVVGITDYEPMDYKDESGNWTGFDAEFAEAVAKELGVKAEFIEIDWDNKIMELDSKSIDCVWNGMTLTDEVKNGMNCTDPYVINAQVVVMSKDKVDNYKSVEDFKDVKFAAEAGSAGEAAIKDSGYECTAVSTQADALMEVSSGAADACVIDITMANAMTGEGTSYANLKAGISLTEEEYGIGFRKGSDMTDKVNEIMANFKKDGTLKKLADKYKLTIAE